MPSLRLQIFATYALLCVSGHMALVQQKFQIATIKPSAPNTGKHTQSRGTKFATTGTTVEDLLKFAYNVHVSQTVGGPSWVRTEQFDVLTDPEMDRRPSLDELKAMTVLDANILLRAVFGVRILGLLETYEDSVWFYAPDICFVDARKYIPSVSAKRRIDPAPGLAVLDHLSQLVEIVDRSL